MTEAATAPAGAKVEAMVSQDGVLTGLKLTNEPPGKTVVAREGSRFARIRTRGREILERFGIGKQPEARCQKCGLPEADCECLLGPDPAPVAENLPGGPAGDPAQGPVQRDPLIIKRSIAAIGRAARKFGDKIIFRKALEATGDKEYAKEITAATSATDDECEALGEVADMLLKELGLDSKYVPLAASLVMVGGAGSRYYFCIQDLNKQIARKHAIKNEPPKP